MSFKAVSGPILAGAALVLALLGSLYEPATVVRVNLVGLAVGGLVTLAVLLSALNMILSARRSVGGRLPRTRSAIVAGAIATGPVTLVLDRSELFGVNLVVTVYYAEHMELGGGAVIEQLSVGRVSNVQQNGLVQVLVLVEIPVHAELWQRIRNREAATIGQVVVKPSIPYDQAGVEVRFNG